MKCAPCRSVLHCRFYSFHYSNSQFLKLASQMFVLRPGSRPIYRLEIRVWRGFSKSKRRREFSSSSSRFLRVIKCKFCAIRPRRSSLKGASRALNGQKEVLKCSPRLTYKREREGRITQSVCATVSDANARKVRMVMPLWYALDSGLHFKLCTSGKSNDPERVPM